MSFLNRFTRFFKKLVSYKKTAIALLLLLIAWYGMRSCTRNGELKEHVFVIASDNKWYPSLSGREPYMQGFVTDLLQEISREEDFRFRFTAVSPAQIYGNLDRGNYDAVMASMIPDFQHRKKYLFSDPFYLVGPVLVVPINSKIKTIADLSQKSVGIRRGSSAIYALSGDPTILIVTFDNMNDATERLIADRLDAVIMDSMIAHIYSQGAFSGKIKVVTNPLTEDGLRMIAPHGESGEYIIDKFNAGLKKLKANGTYLRFLQKWELINTDINTAPNNP